MFALKDKEISDEVSPHAKDPEGNREATLRRTQVIEDGKNTAVRMLLTWHE